MTYFVVDTTDSVSYLVDQISEVSLNTTTPREKPHIFLDVKSTGISHTGKIKVSTITIHVEDSSEASRGTYIIDVLMLGSIAFSIPGDAWPECNLKTILESGDVQKAFWNFRNAAHMLSRAYKIDLQTVCDIQLMEAIRRKGDKKILKGLFAALKSDIEADEGELDMISDVNILGLRLLSPDFGGSPEGLNGRPLLEDLKNYLLVEVAFLPRLWEAYHRRRSRGDQRKLIEVTGVLLAQAKSEGFDMADMASQVRTPPSLLSLLGRTMPCFRNQ